MIASLFPRCGKIKTPLQAQRGADRMAGATP
jgi:hypothetical protein